MVPCIWRWLAIPVLHAKAGSAKVHLADRAAPSAMWYIASIWHLTHPMIIHAPVIIVPTHLPIALGNVIATCTAIVGSEARQADPLPPLLVHGVDLLVAHLKGVVREERMAEKNTSSNGRHSTPRPSFVTRFRPNIDPPATIHRDREVVSMPLAHSSKKTRVTTDHCKACSAASKSGHHSTPRPSFVTRFGPNIDPPATTHRDRKAVSIALAHSSKKPGSKRTTARRAALVHNLDTIRCHDHGL